MKTLDGELEEETLNLYYSKELPAALLWIDSLKENVGCRLTPFERNLAEIAFLAGVEFGKVTSKDPESAAFLPAGC